MTRVDFYILEDESPATRQVYACRVAEKAYQQGRRVYLHVPDGRAAEQMDALLWTFRPGSFVPHARIEQDADEQTPVHIGSAAEPGHHHDVLINLGDDVPLFFSRFERVAEVVAGDAQQKARARDRFRFYRERGYELKTHNVGRK